MAANASPGSLYNIGDTPIGKQGHLGMVHAPTKAPLRNFRAIT